MIERADRAPPRHRPADDLLPRRDPPLQQGPAGRAAARGRGGAGDADRRDHREPLLRGQLGAALAQPDLRAARARARAGARSCSTARSPIPSAGSPTRPAIADEALELLAERSGGDARTALGALERAVEAARAGGGEIDLATAEDALQRKAVTFDKQGDRHYDYASALIKSMRGSDPDAAALLPGGDARGRRGPALHRPADGDPRLRGHRQRRPAGAARGDRGRRRPSTGSGCPSARSTSPRRRPTWRWRRSRTRR